MDYNGYIYIIPNVAKYVMGIVITFCIVFINIQIATLVPGIIRLTITTIILIIESN